MSRAFIAGRAGALALALLLAAPDTNAQETKLSPADSATLKAVDDHYNHLKSLKTRFTETYDGLGMHKVETGTLLLSKPGRMRWSYTEPREKVFVLDGKYAWSYASGDAQAQRTPAKQMDDLRSPLRLLLGHASLARELTGIHVQPEAGGSVITGVPRGQESRLKELTVHATTAGVIRNLGLAEVDGTTTTFQFDDMQENVPVGKGAFAFTPPVGIPIVDGMPPI